MSSAGGGLFSERKNIFLAFLEQTKYLGKTVSAKSDQITLLPETSKLLLTKLQEEHAGTQKHPRPDG